jgi:hypothetical protein
VVHIRREHEPYLPDYLCPHMEGVAGVLPGFQGRQFRPVSPDIRYMFICHRY